jgi:FkbM family methyltransferase
MEYKYYSQYGQDKWLYDNLFKDRKEGFFIEIGADDGIDKSNTLFFEKLGWKGICIEPSLERYKTLRKNRNCICENVAILNHSGMEEFLDIQGWGKGLSGIVGCYDNKHLNRINKELRNPLNKGNKIVKVRTKKLQQILDKYKVSQVDLCSIDVEGSELEVLKSIDFSSVKIKVIMVENNYNDSAIKDFLEKYGYKFIRRIKIDDIYLLY